MMVMTSVTTVNCAPCIVLLDANQSMFNDPNQIATLLEGSVLVSEASKQEVFINWKSSERYTVWPRSPSGMQKICKFTQL